MITFFTSFMILIIYRNYRPYRDDIDSVTIYYLRYDIDISAKTIRYRYFSKFRFRFGCIIFPYRTLALTYRFENSQTGARIVAVILAKATVYFHPTLAIFANLASASVHPLAIYFEYFKFFFHYFLQFDVGAAFLYFIASE